MVVVVTMVRMRVSLTIGNGKVDASGQGHAAQAVEDEDVKLLMSRQALAGGEMACCCCGACRCRWW